MLFGLLAMATDDIMIFVFGGAALLILLAGFVTAFSKFYRKPGPEEAIVRTGVGGLMTITGKGMIVVPLIMIGLKSRRRSQAPARGFNPSNQRVTSISS